MHDLRLLNTLVAVAEAGTLVDAADLLGLTASAVSQQLTRLEQELGVQLLIRRRDGVVVTDAGKVLVERARQILGATSDAERATQSAAGQSSWNLKLASFSTASIHVLPGAITQFRTAFPKAEVSVIDMADHEQSCQMVSDGRVDIAIIHEYDHVPLAIPNNLIRKRLGRDPLDVLFHRSHLQAKSQKAIAMEELRDESWVLYLPSVVTTRSVSAAAAAAGFVPNIVCEVADSQVACALVASRVGITVMPRMVTKSLSRRDFAIRPLTKSLEREISLVYRPPADIPVLSSLTNSIAEICKPLLT